MPEHILFLTGRLAEKSLKRVLEAMQPAPFTHDVHVLSIQVAGLMTSDMILRRLPPPARADRVLVPGRCRGDLDSLSARFGVPFERGPDDLKDLAYRQAAQVDPGKDFHLYMDRVVKKLNELLSRARAKTSSSVATARVRIFSPSFEMPFAGHPTLGTAHVVRELRGAGNLLGAEQSGHIVGVGFELYCQLLRQSIARLKGEPTATVIRASVKLDFLLMGEARGAALVAAAEAGLEIYEIAPRKVKQAC